MTADEARKFADEIAIAILARGLFLAGEARRKAGDRGADFILSCFKQAADIVELEGIKRQIDLSVDRGEARP